MRKVRIGTVARVKHIQPIPRKAYIEECIRQTVEAGERGCDIVCFPEWFDIYGSCEEQEALARSQTDPFAIRAFYAEFAESIPGSLTNSFAKYAREYNMYIILSMLERDGDGLFNTAAIIDRDGEIVGKYRKTHLFPSENRDFGISFGNEVEPFSLDFGKIGIIICMDIYFPELIRVLTLKGAEIVFLPSQSYGPTETTLEIQARSRALDYNAYFVVSTIASEDYYAPYAEGHSHTGRSYVINPDGITLCDTGHYAGLAVCDIDLDCKRLGSGIVQLRKNKPDIIRDDLLMMRRPELYGAVVQPADNEKYLSGQYIEE